MPGRGIPPGGTGEGLGRARAELLERGVVLLAPVLDDHAVNEATAELLYLESRRPGGEVHLYINTSGGSSAALFALHDTMRHLSCAVATVCTGRAQGAAAILLGAGAAGKRLALPNARVIVQLPRPDPSPVALDAAAEAEQALRDLGAARALLAACTGRTLAEVERDTQRDLLLDAHEAQRYGLVDEVVSPRRLHALPGGLR